MIDTNSNNVSCLNTAYPFCSLTKPGLGPLHSLRLAKYVTNQGSLRMPYLCSPCLQCPILDHSIPVLLVSPNLPVSACWRSFYFYWPRARLLLWQRDFCCSKRKNLIWTRLFRNPKYRLRAAGCERLYDVGEDQGLQGSQVAYYWGTLDKRLEPCWLAPTRLFVKVALQKVRYRACQDIALHELLYSTTGLCALSSAKLSNPTESGTTLQNPWPSSGPTQITDSASFLLALYSATQDTKLFWEYRRRLVSTGWLFWRLIVNARSLQPRGRWIPVKSLIWYGQGELSDPQNSSSWIGYVLLSVALSLSRKKDAQALLYARKISSAGLFPGLCHVYSRRQYIRDLERINQMVLCHFLFKTGQLHIESVLNV